MTINYTEKGKGQHKAVEDAGLTLVQHEGEWVASDEAAVQAILDGYTLDQAKAAKCAEVLAYSKSLRDKIVASVSPGEMASWPIKRAEANAYNADPTAACPMLTAEATARGITLADLITKVNGNASYFAGKESAIGGNDGKHRDAINAISVVGGDEAAAFAAVEAYDFSTGWPAV